MFVIHSLYSNVNVVQNSQIKANQTEIKPEKGQTFTQLFLPHNNYFDKQTDRQKIQTEGPKNMYIDICYLQTIIIDSLITNKCHWSIRGK